MIIDYKVVRDTSLTYFQEKVRGAMENGWQLQGGVAVSGDQHSSDYLQAMVWVKGGGYSEKSWCGGN